MAVDPTTLDPPIGDVAGMRAKASQLWRAAEHLDWLSWRLQSRVEATPGRGAHDARWRSAMLDRRHDAEGLAAKVRDLADRLSREAGKIEGDQASFKKMVQDLLRMAGLAS